jgi:hypothetical protein
LKVLPLRNVVVTDTIEERTLSFPLEVVSVPPEIAKLIRLHDRAESG